MSGTNGEDKVGAAVAAASEPKPPAPIATITIAVGEAARPVVLRVPVDLSPIEALGVCAYIAGQLGLELAKVRQPHGALLVPDRLIRA
jgi:hypothetical protein